LVSDRHSAGLISRDGSAERLCFPRFDWPSVFARLLDDEAGHWAIRPAVPYETTRRYLPQTMVLETTFRTGSGTVVLTDALLTGPDDGGHRLGVGVPEGCQNPAMDVDLRLRGRARPWPSCSLIFVNRNSPARSPRPINRSRGC
jgi:hypothetical protein